MSEIITTLLIATGLLNPSPVAAELHIEPVEIKQNYTVAIPFCTPLLYNPPSELVKPLETKVYSKTDIVNLIYQYTLEPKIMTAVAICESGLNPQAKNPRSTAGGVFQILDGTWNAFSCEGSKFNPVDNIRCAERIRKDKLNHWSESWSCIKTHL